MKIQLSDHFTYRKLLRFVLPSVIMMIFTSIYGVVDGLFVSNLVGKTPFAAINLIMPFLMMFGALGFMIGTGGSAIVSMTLGTGDKPRANRYFSLLIYVTVGAGMVLTVISQLLLRPVAGLLGAEGAMLKYCVQYGRIILAILPAFMLQNVFQSFLVTAEKPQLGLFITVTAGVSNMTLDFLFIRICSWGLEGAAIATAISQAIGGIIPLIYFISPNGSLLRLTKTSFGGRTLIRTCTNGSSELMTNISMSLVNMLYNSQLMKFTGEDGVAAYGVIMYVNFIFISIFIGYSIGSAPIVGYHYGAGHASELKNLFRKCLSVIALCGFVLTLLSELLALPLARLFVGYDTDLLTLTCRGFRLYSVSFLFNGFNIFGSSFFTALGNGLISALISFLRTLLFQMASVLFLPLVFGIDGVWLSIVAAELLALFITGTFFITQRKKYEYI